MTGQDVYDARMFLGMAWGLGRGLTAAEFGRILRLKGQTPGRQVLRWEAGANVPGPASVAIEMMMRGGRPEALQTMERV